MCRSDCNLSSQRQLLAFMLLISMTAGCIVRRSIVQADSTSYSIAISLDPSTSLWSIDTKIETPNWTTAGKDVVLLHPGAKIDSIKQIVGTLHHRIEWTATRGDSLVLTGLDSTAAPGSSNVLTLLFAYDLPGGTLATGDILLRTEERWYPVIADIPFRYQIIVTAPTRYRIFSGGQLQSTQRDSNFFVSTWRMDNLTYVMPLILVDTTDVRTISSHESGIQVDFYAHIAPDSTGLAIIRQCVKSLEYYGSLFGSYPFKKFTLIEVPEFQAVQSLPGLMIVGGWAPKYFWHSGFGDWPAHEVAHQWIGNVLLTNSLSVAPGRLFIEESLSEFLRVEFIRNEFGDDSASFVLAAYQKEVEELIPDVSDRSLYRLKFETKVDFKMAYRHGTLTWQRVKNSLGEEQWLELLGRISKDHWYQPFGYDDLRRIMMDIQPDHATVNLMDSLVGYANDID